MKQGQLSAAALAALSSGIAAFAPSPRPLPTSRSRQSRRGAALRVSLALPDPYKNLPWNVARAEEREARRLTVENAALFRELGLAEDATYEDVAATTGRLIDAAKELPKIEGIKQRVRVEIARDKIYQIRLGERIAGVRGEQEDAARMTKLENDGIEGLHAMTTDGIDDIIKPKQKFRIPILSGIFEWGQTIFTPPDDAWRQRNLIIWGAFTLLCLLLPSLTEGFASMNWMPAGGMIGFRGQPVPEGGGGGYNPFRGKRNKKHNLVAMGIAIVSWVMAKGVASKFVRAVPAMAASRSADWFEFAIVQTCLCALVMYSQTYKEGEEGKDLMV